ncbi:histidinol-phosphate transaminase [Synechococcus sp. UW105]|uniref:pyridoxal phosphate-dependent aminotransferase n=1 Tax=Synechococcus sp. UW105 TaxID=337067 RepID=UPI000E0FA361|nr:threonine-phosphate decarboxylase [Synechococcus sp. UW105]
MTSQGPAHGGNLSDEARRLGCDPRRLLDVSASLVPFRPPSVMRRALAAAIDGSALRDYPDRGQADLREAIAQHHGVDAASVLPGNGAAELFTWAARDAAAVGVSLLPTPGFSDYVRSLKCWDGALLPLPLPLSWGDVWPQSFPETALSGHGSDCLWITNPHNPTGQLWDLKSLTRLLPRYALVICDEAFLPLVPGGEAQSMIPLLQDYPNLVVIRSLTKLFAVAGLRLGYAVASSQRLQRWAAWRDPWAVNGLALAAGVAVMRDRSGLQRWTQRVHDWVHHELPWLRAQLDDLPGLKSYPSSANYLLVEAKHSLMAMREGVARRGVLLRDCRSFEGLGECWLRIGLQTRANNRRIIHALRQELDHQPLV